MAVSDPEEFWRKEINKMATTLPDDGDKPPEIESIKEKKQNKDGSRKVLVHKVITHIYVFTDIEGKVYTSNTSQKMQILGTMSLQRALKMAQEDELT
jgi:hypothetical protein